MSEAFKGRVLVVDDDPEIATQIAVGLGRLGFATEACFDVAEVEARLEASPRDVVLVDVHMPGQGGIALCAQLVQRWPAVTVFVMSGQASLDGAVAAIKAGAYDFITKPFSLEATAIRIARIVAEQARRREIDQLRALVAEPGAGGELLGTSPPMRVVHDLIDRLASSEATILITGASGTGKEVVAKTLHGQGRRRGGPFVAVNCAALPEALLESELFGHARGAFTDARSDRDGLFVEARGGTLLLDEIGELPLALQAKLLRALEERAVRPVGGNREIAIDVRLLVATNRDLAAEVAAGRFRVDLFYRLNVIRMELPALGARGDDVLLLARRFTGRYAAQEQKPIAGFSGEVADRLLAYAWPGNVRELRNCIEHAVAMTRGPELTVDDLPPYLRAAVERAPVVDGRWVTLDEVERSYIARVLAHTRNNRSQAARILGVDRRTLLRKLAEVRGADTLGE